MEHADRAVAEEEGHPEHRLDVFLAENRVDDVGPVEVVEDDRSALSGDAAGEAPAHWDADALRDLLLDADRGARRELVGLLVEQQHGARIGPEDVADAR